jgi:hypothetical protein
VAMLAGLLAGMAFLADLLLFGSLVVLAGRI